jgi:5-methylcytosine-specific restriction endonuclease McrA
MTERESLDYLDRRQAILFRDGYTCQWCGAPVTFQAAQLAHRIPQGKRWRAKYGDAVIYHPDNMVTTCGLDCNNRYDIRNHPLECAALALEIAGKLDKRSNNA